MNKLQTAATHQQDLRCDYTFDNRLLLLAGLALLVGRLGTAAAMPKRAMRRYPLPQMPDRAGGMLQRV